MIKKIKTIADELAKNGGAFSRADLAYELKMADSVEVEKLVWDAYVKYHNDKNIADAFISNDGGMSVVDFAAEMAKSLNISNLKDDFYVEHGSLEVYSAQYDAAVQKGLEAFQSYTRLKMQFAQEKITVAFYDNELSRIKGEFMGMIRSIDKKSRCLHDVFAKINTAESPGNLKDALLELSDNQINISESDFELFLQGKKQIEI